MNIFEALAEIRDAILGETKERDVVAFKRTPAASGHSVEDVISESATVGTAFEFTGMANKRGGAGEILEAQVFLQTTALAPRLTLYLFSVVPTSALNDNVANTAVLLADLPTYIKKIDFLATEDLGGVSETLVSQSTYGNLPIHYVCDGNSTSLYGILVTRDAVTLTANDRVEIRLRRRIV